MSVLLVARGSCLLGMVRRDADGNIVKQTAAKFETDAKGVCVAICELDPETMEPVSASEVYGDYQADLSVAGKRAGLAGERSGLFMEQIRIIKEMREVGHGRAHWPSAQDFF